MEELVKKEPVTPSPDTTTSNKLVTLDARKASKNSEKKKPVISSPKPQSLVDLLSWMSTQPLAVLVKPPQIVKRRLRRSKTSFEV